MKQYRNIIAALALIAGISAAACNGKKPEETKAKAQTVAKEPPPPTEKPAPAAPEKPVFKGPGERLVKSAGDWTLSGAPRYFGPDNLYDLINGGSEIYIAYGFKEMVTADYTSKKKPDVTVTAEIYDMGSPLNAFGRFSKFLQGKEDPAESCKNLPDKIASRGLFGGANASFWKGSFLVNLTLLDGSATATVESMTSLGAEALPAIMSALDENIKGTADLPSETTLFPKKNLVQMSYLYELPSLLKIKELGPGFSASYKQGDLSWSLFTTAAFKDNAAAETALKNIAEALEKDGITAKTKGPRIIGLMSVSDKSAEPHAKKSLKEMTAAAFR